MPRNDTAAYHVGDRLDDGRGSIGIVVQRTSRAGNPYLKVQVIEGPRRGAWLWPNDFARPLLDHDPNGLPENCGECGRRFRGTSNGYRTVFCLQCTRQQESADRGRATAEAHDGPAKKHRRWVTEEMRQREAAEKHAAEIADVDTPF